MVDKNRKHYSMVWPLCFRVLRPNATFSYHRMFGIALFLTCISTMCTLDFSKRNKHVFVYNNYMNINIFQL